MSAVAQKEHQTPADEAWVLLRELLNSQRRRFMNAASELELHPAQAGALLHIEPEQGLPMNELASMLACDNSNVTGIVDRLEARGLVTRRPYAQDRRVKHVVLTPLGVELRNKLLARLADAPPAIAKLSPDDQRLLRDVLRRALASA